MKAEVFIPLLISLLSGKALVAANNETILDRLGDGKQLTLRSGQSWNHCFSESFKVDFQTATTTDASTAQKCHKKCVGSSACDYFSFDKANRKCHLIKYRTNYSPFAISGSKYCSKNEWQCQHNQEAYSLKIIQTQLNTGKECPAKCLGLKSCDFWSFVYPGHGSDYFCRLHKVDGAIKIGWTSGPKKCPPPPTCFSDNFKVHFQGATRIIVSSAQKCQDKCAKSSACDYFSYRETWWYCHLINYRQDNKNALCGSKDCKKAACVHDNEEYSLRFSKLSLADTDRDHKCPEMCLRSNSCVFWSVVHPDRVCKLHKVDGARKHGWTSGPKKCP